MRRAWATTIFALAMMGCDGAPPANIVPAPSSAAANPALRAHAGDSFSNFVTQAGARYAPEAMGLPALDRTRLWRGMANAQAGELVSGGGAEALVFRGCATEGCADGYSIVAVDTTTGGVFIGVRDVGGSDILARDERMLALLEATSTASRWDDPDAPPRSAAPAATSP
jgi:hypothetical protein